MPTRTRTATGASSPSSARVAVSTAPPPPGLLLHSGGGVEPFVASRSQRPSRDIIEDDAHALLGPEPGATATERWAAATFVRQVAAIRRHLAPIGDSGLLVASFGREAFHGSLIGRLPAIATSPVRVAYAIRWIELVADVRLPEWSAWLEPCPPDR